jgi:hypothetical protein
MLRQFPKKISKYSTLAPRNNGRLMYSFQKHIVKFRLSGELLIIDVKEMENKFLENSFPKQTHETTEK